MQPLLIVLLIFSYATDIKSLTEPKLFDEPDLAIEKTAEERSKALPFLFRAHNLQFREFRHLAAYEFTLTSAACHWTFGTLRSRSFEHDLASVFFQTGALQQITQRHPSLFCIPDRAEFPLGPLNLGNEEDPTIAGALQDGDTRLGGHVSQFLTVDWIPDQRAMVCRNRGSRSYMCVRQSVHNRPYDFARPFCRRWNNP